TVKTIDRLCGLLRSQVDEVRRLERDIRRIAVDRCGMPHEQFVERFVPRALDLGWAQTESTGRKAYCAALGRHLPAIQELQARLIELQTLAGIPLDELMAIQRRMNDGERELLEAKWDMIEASLRIVNSLEHNISYSV